MSKVQSPKPKNASWLEFGIWTLDFGQLTVTDLRKAFLSPSGGRIEVLRGISFSAVAGETIAIVGASGAGKSTLLNLVGGIEAADHGKHQAR